MSRPAIFSTKKLSASLLQQLEQAEIDISQNDFIRIQPVISTKLAEKIAALMQQETIAVFTSANAAGALRYYLTQSATPNKTKDWTIFCLSGRTRETVLQIFNEAQVIDVADNAHQLAEKITTHDIKEVTFFCGDQRRDELPSALQRNGVLMNELVVYETIETPSIMAGAPDAILFFSPSAVKSFFSVNKLSPGVVCFAIGNTTATAIRDFTGNKIMISESPDQESMLNMVQHYLRNINCDK